MSDGNINRWISELKLVPIGENLYAGVVLIQRHVALSMLRINRKNRNPKPMPIERYGSDMLDGAWRLTGEPIIISSSNTLLNGQNRLHACVNSGAAFETVVVVGVPDESMPHMDSGKSRNNSDVLSIEGEKSSLVLAGACSWIFKYRRGLMKAGGTQTPSVANMHAILESDPGIRDHVKWVINKSSQLYGGPSVNAMLRYFTFTGEYVDWAQNFWDRIADGVGLDATSPILTLRNQFARMKTGKKPNTSITAAFIIKTWNAHVEDVPLKLLRFLPTTEEFPMLIGTESPIQKTPKVPMRKVG